MRSNSARELQRLLRTVLAEHNCLPELVARSTKWFRPPLLTPLRQHRPRQRMQHEVQIDLFREWRHQSSRRFSPLRILP